MSPFRLHPTGLDWCLFHIIQSVLISVATLPGSQVPQQRLTDTQRAEHPCRTCWWQRTLCGKASHVCSNLLLCGPAHGQLSQMFEQPSIQVPPGDPITCWDPRERHAGASKPDLQSQHWRRRRGAEATGRPRRGEHVTDRARTAKRRGKARRESRCLREGGCAGCGAQSTGPSQRPPSARPRTTDAVAGRLIP